MACQNFFLIKAKKNDLFTNKKFVSYEKVYNPR